MNHGILMDFDYVLMMNPGILGGFWCAPIFEPILRSLRIAGALGASILGDLVSPWPHGYLDSGI